jgi:uncharacterized protein YfbU (UPF0304 family)
MKNTIKYRQSMYTQYSKCTHSIVNVHTIQSMYTQYRSVTITLIHIHAIDHCLVNMKHFLTERRVKFLLYIRFLLQCSLFFT